MRTTRWIARGAFLTSLFLLLPAHSALADDSVLPGSDLHGIFEARLTPVVLVGALGAGDGPGLRLPQLWAYDAEGRELLHLTGFTPTTFRQHLEDALTSPRPESSSPSLDERLEAVTDLQGDPLGELPTAEMTVVKYWADWCKPCKAQSAMLTEVLADHPGRSINVVHVDADFSAAGPEGAPPIQPIRLDTQNLDPELIQKLRKGELSPEEIQELLGQPGQPVTVEENVGDGDPEGQ